MSSLVKETPDGPRLIASKCKSCGKVYFPKRTRCPKCLEKGEMEEFLLSKTGRIYSYTISYLESMVPGGPAPPFAYGIVELPEGVWLVSLFEDCEPFDKVLRVGLDVEMLIDGNTLKFRPAEATPRRLNR